MPKHYVTDCSMDDEEMSHASWRSGTSSVRSGPAAYGGNYDNRRQQYGPYGAASSYSSDADLSLKRDREREGRCSECGVQTHEFRIDSLTGRHVKVPMTVENEGESFCNRIVTYDRFIGKLANILTSLPLPQFIGDDVCYAIPFLLSLHADARRVR